MDRGSGLYQTLGTKCSCIQESKCSTVKVPSYIITKKKF
jgi:hypothetical protein